MDENDRKHGRPLRTKKASVTESGIQDTSVATHMEAAKYHSMEDALEECKDENYVAWDVVECAADELDYNAGFSDDLCALVDLYFNDAEYIAEEILSTWLASGDATDELQTYIDDVESMKTTGKAEISAERKAAYDVEVGLIAAALGWYGNSGTIGDLQTLLDEYAYCWDMVPDLMSNEMYEREIHNRFDLSVSDVLEAGEAALDGSATYDWDGTCEDGSSSNSVGACMKIKYDIVKALKVTAPKASHAQHIRQRAKKAKVRNRKNAKSGKFHRYKYGDRK